MKKVYKSEKISAVQRLSEILNDNPNLAIPTNVKAEIVNVFKGVELLDQEIKQKESVINQKTAEVQATKQVLLQKEIEKEHAVRSKSVEKNNLLAKKEQEVKLKTSELQNTKQVLLQKDSLLIEKDQLLVQKEKEKKELLSNKEKQVKELETFRNDNLIKELIETLPQVYPDYNKPFEKWHPTSWGKKAINEKDFKSIESKLPGLKQQAKEQSVKKELIDVLHKLHPTLYPDNFSNWANSETKKVIESNNYQEMGKLLILNKERLNFKQSQEIG